MTLFKLLLCSYLVGYLCYDNLQAQNVPVYIYFGSHNETTDIIYHGLDYNDAADYNTMRNYVKQVCDTIIAHDARYEMMLESNFILACLQHENAYTDPNDLIEWADNTPQIEVQPHNHFKPLGINANPYNYADLCYLLDSCGLSSTSEVMGGFIWRNFTSPSVPQDWTQWQTPQPGFTFPAYSWQPTLLWGGGSPNHIDDYNAYGIWKPQAPTLTGFGTHNPLGSLVNFGTGCGEEFILWDTTNVVLLAYRILNFVDSVQVHFASTPNAFFNMKIMMNFRSFPSAGYAAKVGQLISLIQPYICLGKMEWKNIMEAYQIWQTLHPNVNDYFNSQCESTVTISNNPHYTGNISVNIDGTNITCGNTIQTYSVPFIDGSTYIWTVTGGNITEGQGTPQIAVLWANGVAAGTVSVVQTMP